MKFVFFLGLVVTLFAAIGIAQRNTSAVESKRARSSGQVTSKASSNPDISPGQIEAAISLENGNEEPPKILSQPRASWPPNSGLICLQGTVLLRVELLSEGTIGRIAVVRGLPYGFTEQASLAAKKITFVPAMKGGVPITTVRIFEYRFGIY